MLVSALESASHTVSAYVGVQSAPNDRYLWQVLMQVRMASCVQPC